MAGEPKHEHYREQAREQGADLSQVYAAPKDDEDLPSAGRNPIHTGIFGTLFVLLVLGAPLFLGGLAGLLAAPIIGGVLWGLYTITLPKGPKIPAVTETAGVLTCPSCGSVQTDRLPVAEPGTPTWQCFSCDHRW